MRQPNATVTRTHDHLVMIVGPVTMKMSARMAIRLTVRLLKLADAIMNGPPK